jgi:GAF domain-containing protein
MPDPTVDAIARLGGLVEVVRRAGRPGGLDRALREGAAAIAELAGFRTVVVNLYRPAFHDLEVACVHGDDLARDELIGRSGTYDSWMALLSRAHERRDAHFLPEDEVGLDGVPTYRPPVSASAWPAAWHPDDTLLVAMRDSSGELLGIVSVDEPLSGMRPSDDQLDVLVAVTRHVGMAVLTARDVEQVNRHQAMLERLVQLSFAAGGPEEVLQRLCDAIVDLLSFEMCLVVVDDPAGGPRVAASVGVPPGDPVLDVPLSAEQVQRLMVPELERCGCYLASREQALERVGLTTPPWPSRRNGAGPRAWHDHWLLVPLDAGGGVHLGWVWVDDPADRLLPTNARLRAMRTIADRAVNAIRHDRQIRA